MKTTVELPDDLFRAAKVTAAQRNISLKNLFIQALRKEISPASTSPSASIQVDEDGLPYLVKRGKQISSDQIDRLDEETGP